MKKLISMFTIMIMSLLGLVGLSQPAYAYFTLDTGINPLVKTITLQEDGYQIDDSYFFVLKVDISTPHTSRITLFFDETTSESLISLIEFSNNYPDFTEYGLFNVLYGDDGNDISNYVFEQYIYNLNTFYIYVQGESWNLNNITALATLTSKLQIYNGSMQYFFNSIKNYDDGLGDGYNNGYLEGQDNLFLNGSDDNGYIPENSYDYRDGYENGQDDMYTNGSNDYGYVASGSYDYAIGLADGQLANIDAANINFMEHFKDWIIPTIIIVLLLGSFIYIKNDRSRED